MSHDALDLDQRRTHTPLTWRDWALGGTAALTLYSTGVAWQAQVVSYPLFGEVSAAEFPEYHLAYNAAIPLVVIVPGFLSFFASAALPWTRPADDTTARLTRRTAQMVSMRLAQTGMRSNGEE